MENNCALAISVKTVSGTSTRTETSGRYYLKKDRHHVLFETEGDRCRIEFDEKDLIYHRKGSLSYSLHLLKGSGTKTRMLTPFGSTEVTCLTHEYILSETEGEIIIKIRYNIADEDSDMEIMIRKDETR